MSLAQQAAQLGPMWVITGSKGLTIAGLCDIITKAKTGVKSLLFAVSLLGDHLCRMYAGRE